MLPWLKQCEIKVCRMALVLQELRDTDTNSDFNELSEVPVGRACTTRPGRVLRVDLRLDI